MSSTVQMTVIMPWILVALIPVLAAMVTTHNPQALGQQTQQGQQTMTRTEFLQKLLEGYDSRVPPNFDDDNATEVTCDVFISSFDSISESAMDYVISIFFRQQWHDERLDFTHLLNDSMISLDARLADSMWLPDIFFTNEKKAHFHDITKPNRFLRLYANGSVYYSARLSLTLSCPMKLHKFPLDSQRCSMQLESYAYTTSKLLLRWREYTPVEVHGGLELPQFHLTRFTLVDCLKQYTTGDFSCLQVDFLLTRDIGFYMIQTYIPSGLIVMLSWVSFWINVDAVPARISLGVLTILTMTTQSSGSGQNLPRVSYVKAIDVWMASCLLFVFAALLEFAIVNVVSRKEVRRMVTIRRRGRDRERRQAEGENEGGSAPNGKDGAYEFLSDGRVRKETYMEDPFGKKNARMLDKYSRKLFPALFLCFNIIYWSTYIIWHPYDR